jgi:hypothetical protein
MSEGEMKKVDEVYSGNRVVFSTLKFEIYHFLPSHRCSVAVASYGARDKPFADDGQKNTKYNGQTSNKSQKSILKTKTTLNEIWFGF